MQPSLERFTGERDLSGQYDEPDGWAANRADELRFLRRAGLGLQTLENAAVEARRQNVEPHEILLSTGAIGQQAYVEAVAARLGVPAVRPGQPPPEPAMLVDGTRMTPRLLHALAFDCRCRGQSIALATPSVLDSLEPKAVRAARLRHAVGGLRSLDPELSAAGRIRLPQLVVLLAMVGIGIGAAVVAPDATRLASMSLVAVPFLVIVLFRLIVLGTVIGDGLRRKRAKNAVATPDGALPLYSVMVPMFREQAVLPDLVEALSKLDYPAAKLDCMLVLEAADRETIAVARAMALPPYMRIVVVPDCQPRTKPKALNYAIQVARGSLVAVYDAEDVPDPMQLRKAVAAFEGGGPGVVCVQASLSIHNARASWLTRQFALEYSALFAGLLPALARFRLPVPLGGTSNHFRRAFLEEIGGWDAFNVTEDADLGIRIARRGGLIATIDSVTWEEAPHRLRPWIGQRTRWLKGWMQTYLVHMRRPVRLASELGAVSFCAFQVLMGGILLSCLLHPLFYMLMAWELWTGEFLAGSAGPVAQGIVYLAGFNLIAGFACAMATAAITAGKRRGTFLLPHVLLMPFYWLLVSFAAWRALVELGRKPFFWQKTEHAARRRRRESH